MNAIRPCVDENSLYKGVQNAQIWCSCLHVMPPFSGTRMVKDSSANELVGFGEV